MEQHGATSAPPPPNDDPSTARGSNSSSSGGESEFYDDITRILARISKRTIEMKTSNAKLLGRIGTEMTQLVERVHRVIGMCTADRDDFFKHVESIQLDFMELGKRVDQRFAATDKRPLGGSSNLQMLLESSNMVNEEVVDSTASSSSSGSGSCSGDSTGTSDTENFDSNTMLKMQKKKKKKKKKKKAKPKLTSAGVGHFAIPDTCFSGGGSEASTSASLAAMTKAGRLPRFRTVIRDTIDSDKCLGVADEEAATDDDDQDDEREDYAGAENKDLSNIKEEDGDHNDDEELERSEPLLNDAELRKHIENANKQQQQKQTKKTSDQVTAVSSK